MPHAPSTAVPPTPSPASAHAVAKPGTGLAAVAAIACVAQFMVVLDSSIVNVALPSMKAGLGMSATAQQWVVNGYLITFGGLLLLASRASDLFGRRRVFQIGLAVFTAAGLVGGLAADGWMLLAARAVQGAGAAALAPSSLSLITAAYAESPRRTRAMTWWGVAASSAGAAGIVLGGLLTSVSWRWVMLVNVPIGIALLVASLVCLQPTAPAEARARTDVPGAVTVTLAAAAIVCGVSIAPDRGWASGQVLTLLIGGLALLGAFTAIERRTGSPLVPRAVLAVRNVRIGNLLTLCMGVVLAAPLFFLSLYLQQVLGHSALRTGLSLLPMVSVVSVGVLASQKLIPLIGPRLLVVLGALTAAAGLVWLGRLPVHPAYLGHILLPTLVLGAGTSVTMMPAIVAATTGVAPRDSGIASGLINMCRQLGAALGLAALVTLASTITRHSAATGSAAVVDGYRCAFYALAGISAVTAVLALLLSGAETAPPRPSSSRAARPVD